MANHYEDISVYSYNTRITHCIVNTVDLTPRLLNLKHLYLKHSHKIAYTFFFFSSKKKLKQAQSFLLLFGKLISIV